MAPNVMVARLIRRGNLVAQYRHFICWRRRGICRMIPRVMRWEVMPIILLLAGLAMTQAVALDNDASLQMQLGNPSGATADTNNHNHYLIQRPVEAIDYSDRLGEPVWASWDLTTGDVGPATRTASYYVDTNLPATFKSISTSDYNGVGNIGFNRGHLCPSEDRTDDATNNKTLFFLSNIMPQSAANNQGPWVNFETYCRSLTNQYEMLIICGPSGFGTNALPSGKVFLPSNSWKIVVCVPLGSGKALGRLSATNRVIAISVPNATNGLSADWRHYVTSPRQIELDTGFTFFTALPSPLAGSFRSMVDGAPICSTVPAASPQFKFQVTGWTGTNYVVQAIADLAATNWMPVLTNAAPFVFVETNASRPGQRYYRVVKP